MKITVETSSSKCENYILDNSDIQEAIDAFASCLAGVGYHQYELIVEEGEEE